MISLRRTWPDDPERADYQVLDERGTAIGRMYAAGVPGGGERWLWTVYGIAVRNLPPAGMTDTREEAMVAFREAWSQCEPDAREIAKAMGT